MNRNLGIILSLLMLTGIVYAQGPNRTFGKFKKIKSNTGLICSDNCATIILIYEKGTYINTVKAALGIDDKYAIASDKGYYIEVKIPAGIHKISLPQGVNQGSTIHKVEKCNSPDTSFIGLCSMYSDMDNYQILIGNDAFEIEYNLTGVPYTNKMFADQMNYLTYKRDFLKGQTYYFKTLKLPQGTSLACGPVVTETTQKDSEIILQGEKIKEKGDVYFYIDPEKK